MERDTPQPNQATPSAGPQAACGAAPPASAPSGLAAELWELRARLRRAHKHAAATLNAGLSGLQPGEALKRFLAADAEVAATVRRVKEIQTLTKGRKNQSRESSR